MYPQTWNFISSIAIISVVDRAGEEKQLNPFPRVAPLSSQQPEILIDAAFKEVQIVYRLFLVNCYLLYVPRLPSQPASSGRGWVIGFIWLELPWQYIEMTRNNLSIILTSLVAPFGLDSRNNSMCTYATCTEVLSVYISLRLFKNSKRKKWLWFSL